MLSRQKRMTEKIRKTDQEWRQELDPDRYAVLRCSATEPPWSGDLNYVKEGGVFRCGACGAELFRTQAKFDSGSGWPSFFEPTEEDAVETEVDDSHGMRRIGCAAPPATRIWATSSRTAPTRPASGTASTRSRWTSNRQKLTSFAATVC
jgi:peptide-methionine (R)-S-oxide reductase